VNDIDVLLRPADVSRSIEVLAPLGWRPERRPDMRLLKGYRQIQLLNPDGLAMELHWALMPAGHPFSGDSGPFLERACAVTIAGRQVMKVMTLAPDDLVAASPLDWERTWVRPTDEGYVRPLSVGLCLARDLLGAALPSDACPRDRRAADTLPPQIAWDRSPSRIGHVRFQSRCAQGWHRKISLSAALLAANTTGPAARRRPLCAVLRSPHRAGASRARPQLLRRP
jgi:hypothetical protein